MKKGKRNKKISNRWIYTIVIFSVLILGAVVVNSAWITSEHPKSHSSINIKTTNTEGEVKLTTVISDLLEIFENSQGPLWEINKENKEIYYTDANVGIGVVDPQGRLDVDGAISTDKLYLESHEIWFDETGSLCYSTDIVQECSDTTTTTECTIEYEQVTFNLPSGSAICGLDEGERNSYCIERCEETYVNDPSCKGDVYTDCLGGTTSKWTHGTEVSCKGDDYIQCGCTNPTNFEKETKVSSSGIVCRN